MNALPEFTWSSISLPGLLQLLLIVTLKGSLILIAAGALTFLLRRGSAAARHWIWSLAICGVLVLPLLTLVVPAWPVALLSGPAPAVQDVLASFAPMPERMPAAPQAEPGASILPPVPAVESSAAGPETNPAGWLESWRANGPMDWAAMLWLVGLGFVCVPFLTGTLQVWWLSRRASPVRDEDWRLLARDLAWMLSLDRPVQLLWSDRAAMPMTWGVWRPKVLLPYGANAWPEDRRRVVLLHELAHIKRMDCFTQTLAQAACAVYWFNPLVWWAARQLRVERERACDDQVLNAGARASDYAGHLLEIARGFSSTLGAPLGAVSMAKRSQLEGRVLAILEPGLRHRTMSRVTAGLSSALFAMAVVPLAAVQPDEAPPDDAWAEAMGLIETPPQPASPPEAPWPGVKPEKAHKAEKTHKAGKADSAHPPAPPMPPVQPRMAAAATGVLSADGTLRQWFTVESGGRLFLESERGAVRVRTWDDERVQVDVARTGGGANPEAFGVYFEQQGNDVYVTGHSVGRNASSHRQIRVEYTITVPNRFDLELKTAGGSIDVADLTGEVHAGTSGGSLRFGHIQGSIHGATSGGSIELESASGSAVLSTSGGPIRIGRVRGDVEARTSGGSITVEEVEGDLDAFTSGGAVTARLTRQPRGLCRLETSGGSVELHLAAHLAVSVDAATTGGRVATDFPVASRGKGNPSHLRLDLNGGGPDVVLRTSGGNIQILSTVGRARVDRLWKPDGDRWRPELRAPAREPGDPEALRHAGVEAARAAHPQAGEEALAAWLLAFEHSEKLGELGSRVGQTVSDALVGVLEHLAFEGDDLDLDLEMNDDEDALGLLEVLAQLPREAGVRALSRLSEDHPDPEVRKEACRLLSELGRKTS